MPGAGTLCRHAAAAFSAAGTLRKAPDIALLAPATGAGLCSGPWGGGCQLPCQRAVDLRLALLGAADNRASGARSAAAADSTLWLSLWLCCALLGGSFTCLQAGWCL